MCSDKSVSRRFAVGGLLASMSTPAFADEDVFAPFGQRLRRLGARGVVVQHKGRTILSTGDTDTPLRVASIRKSILSALYGMAVADNRIDLDWTMEDLGIHRLARLRSAEEKATVRQLLQSRSGIYLPASAETGRQADNRPRRGSAKPGENWYYNNWDFNVLGRIYEIGTGEDVFKGVNRRLARPLGWRDFDEDRHTRWQREPRSTPFPAYNIDLSVRDLARFGALYLANGMWNGRRLLSPDWIDESTRAYSRSSHKGLMSGYGYMWWVARDWERDHGFKAYTAVGNGGRYLTVVPDYDLVIAVQPNERRGWPAVRLYADRCAYTNEVGRLIRSLGGPNLSRDCR